MSTASVLTFPPQPPGDLLAEIARRRTARLTALSKAYARALPIASDIDPESCLRRQVLEIVAWQDKPLPGAELQARFEVGNLVEREAIIALQKDGFEVVEQQTPFELVRRGTREPVLRGRTDGKIRWAAEKVPFEVKSMNPNIYGQINTLEDFDRYFWTRKYPNQLQAYLVGYEHPWGFLYLTDCLGHWKPIRMDLDYAMAERIWSFAESIDDGVKAYRKDGTLPGFSERPSDCTHCDFFGRTCNPSIIEPGARFLSDPELLADLERREALIAAGAKKLDSLDKSIKERLKLCLPVPPLNPDETLEAYAARLKELPASNAIAGRFTVEIAPKFVRAEKAPRQARVDRVVTIEALTPEAPPATKPIDLMEALKASLAKGRPATQEGA